jgi:hypothetical protein
MSYDHHFKKSSFGPGKINIGKGLSGLSRWHLIGIIICAALLFCDILTTAIALSGTTGMSFEEANPLIAGVVNDLPTVLLIKLGVLGTMTGGAYVLRNNGWMTYMPYVIVGGMYMLVVLHNVSLLLPAL